MTRMDFINRSAAALVAVLLTGTIAAPNQRPIRTDEYRVEYFRRFQRRWRQFQIPGTDWWPLYQQTGFREFLSTLEREVERRRPEFTGCVLLDWGVDSRGVNLNVCHESLPENHGRIAVCSDSFPLL